MERGVILDPGPGPGPLLSPREATVLRLVVETHVREAAPVASQRLVRNYGLKVSAATVRGVMLSLAEKGLLDRPYRSAGRSPTEQGYRYYVDHLMPSEEPGDRTRRILDDEMRRDIVDRRAFLANLTHVVSVVSRQLGLALVAHVGPMRITTLELVPLSLRRIMTILGLEDGTVRTVIISLDRPVPSEDVARARTVLAEGMLGRDLAEARQVLDGRFRTEFSRRGEALDRLLERLATLFVEEPSLDLIVGSPGEIAMQAEFSRGERLRNLLRLLEERHSIVRTLAAAPGDDGLKVRIGSELTERGLEEMSTVSVTLGAENGFVVFGLLGPMRMDYPRSIALMGWLGGRLKEVLRPEPIRPASERWTKEVP
jgi:heat-inducible transcriptional repressor